MRNGVALLLSLIGLTALGGCAAVPTPPGGSSAPMAPPTPPRSRPAHRSGHPAPVPPRPLAEVIDGEPRLTTFARLLHASGLEPIAGPVTLFAPTDEAVARMTPGTLDALLQPGNRPSLRRLIGYWVVPGVWTDTALRARIAEGGGTATLTTAEGEPITLALERGEIRLGDARGDRGYVVSPDVATTGGPVQVVNGVFVPGVLGGAKQ